MTTPENFNRCGADRFPYRQGLAEEETILRNCADGARGWSPLKIKPARAKRKSNVVALVGGAELEKDRIESNIKEWKKT